MSKPKSSPRKQQLPDYVFPLGVRFNVQVASDLTEEEDEYTVMGDTNVDLKRIRVVDSQDSGRRWSTLYHEYLHATLGLVGLDDMLSEYNEHLEETLVRTIETTTEQFLLAHGTEWLEALRSQKAD